MFCTAASLSNSGGPVNTSNFIDRETARFYCSRVGSSVSGTGYRGSGDFNIVMTRNEPVKYTGSLANPVAVPPELKDRFHGRYSYYCCSGRCGSQHAL